MYSFLIDVVALILGYFIYGKFVDRVFGADSLRPTPVATKEDGVDYVRLPAWKIYMIQFLNIAGTGPIFGAIMGARFGPSSYPWIVLGSIFAGAVHDYFSGMLSLRHGGISFPNVVGHYLGSGMKKAMLVFSLILLLLVGTVFVYSPALIFGELLGDGSARAAFIWVIVIFGYYVVATLLPVDKVIGRIYPLFAFALIFMAISLMICLFVKWPDLPELWYGFGNWGAASGFTGMKEQPIFPYLFITIACGAISGFHATQSPLMARCLTDEKLGRPVFYGAMVTEGIVALVWSAVASYFFYDGGAAHLGVSINSPAPVIVTKVSRDWLGVFGGILTVFGVVAAPITSGDTAFRSARLIIADFFHMDQSKISSRLLIALPIFAVTMVLLFFNITNENGFNIIWRYFGWANQTLACFTLWTAAVWLHDNRKGYYWLMAAIPGSFMCAVSFSYIMTAKIGFNLPLSWVRPIALTAAAVSMAAFVLLKVVRKR